MYNPVSQYVETLSLESDYVLIKHTILQLVQEDLYSYFVGRKEDVITIKIYISNIDDYNTISKIEAQENIITSIIDYIVSLSDNRCITFQQPPLELIIKLYQPLLKKMVDRILQQWKWFEYDDLLSMANFAIIKLYRQGYYVNKSIIWTTLNNDVLMECRKRRGQNDIVSFEEITKSNIKIDSEELTYGDIVKDESIEEDKVLEDEKLLEKYTFEQVRDIVIDKIGVRRWDRLWRDYSKGHTTNVTQKEMLKLKQFFKELGLTRQDFINGYRR